MRAIAADDDRISLEVAARTLTRWGFEVTAAHDGTEAWAAIGAVAEPTIAVLDWMMPGLDGPDLCRLIRGADQNGRVYVILLTSRDMPADIVAGLEAGADDYVTKPFDPEELHARVRVGVRVLTLQQTLADRVAELQDALGHVKQLQGLVPICSYCKRIRNDENYWEQVEHYVAAHTDAQFSHGICPSCFEAIKGQFAGNEL